MGRSPSRSHRLSDDTHARLTMLAELASYRVEELFDELGVDCRRSGKMYVGPCPVHGGDKANGWNFYPDGHTVRGLWHCNTRHCEKAFQRTIPGLVRGCLSAGTGGWSGREADMVPMKLAADWLCEFVGQKWGELRPDLVATEKHRFVADMAALGCYPEVKADGWDVGEVRKRLQIPSPYFLGRGFSAGVLERFSVGDAKTEDVASPMYRRAVVPVFAACGRVVAGTTGRSLFEKCERCGVWHDPATPCPPPADRGLPRYAKWRNTAGFRREDHLYGWDTAKDVVLRTGKVLLVESPGNTLRAREAGCGTAVGLFGTGLADPQQIILESSGAAEVFVCMDADAAGEAAAREIVGQLGRSFRVRVLKPPRADLGESPAGEVREWAREYGLLTE